jgi:ATP-dependent RNA helicase DeaD
MEEIKNFEDLGLDPKIMQGIADLGFETPMPIQAKAIPIAMAGQDIFGQAQTGTGKTAAFGLPILQKIRPKEGPQALIICPTRELAVQVSQEITRLSRHLDLMVVPIYGGQSIEHQIRILRKGPEVVVGTPGRLLDHMNRRTLRLDTITTLVLDEADEMLDMGFVEDIRAIIKATPPERQTMMFSATLPPEVTNLAKEFMNDPQSVHIARSGTTVALTEQRYYEVNPRQKVETLCRLLDVESPEAGIIFCRTKQGTAELARELLERGYTVDALHGDLSQRERDSAMNRFRTGISELLVATDVAARGLDISNVTHVINFDIPQDPDTYVHRIGRTGRAGKEGIAITLVTPREIKQLRFIENGIRKKIARHDIPTLSDAREVRLEQLLKRIADALQESAGHYKDMAGRLLEEYDSLDLLATCLKIIDNDGRDMETAELEAAKPEWIKILLPVGRSNGLHPKVMVHEIISRTNLTPKQIGDIEIYDKSSYVEVPVSASDQVYAAFRNYKGRSTRRPSGSEPRGKKPADRRPRKEYPSRSKGHDR